MTRRIAYFGDTDLPGPASYLAGIMTHCGISFTHTPSEQPPEAGAFADDVGLYVISDYPASMWDSDSMAQLCQRLESGVGICMFGGWESYHGLGGDYDTSPLAKYLPVQMRHDDDRRNWSQLALVRSVANHAITRELPFDAPPGIGGYNDFEPTPDSETVLAGECYSICVKSSAPKLTLERTFPLLVVADTGKGEAGAGRRACLATDVAPHWVGGMVDWGDERVTVSMDNDSIEVGCHYVTLFRNILLWTMGDM